MRYILFPFVSIVYVLAGMFLTLCLASVYFFELFDGVTKEVQMISDHIINVTKRKINSWKSRL